MGILNSTSDFAQRLAQFAAQVSEAPLRADPTPSALALDPGEQAQVLTRGLLDLKIPKSLENWLIPPLSSLGFSIKPVDVEGRFGSPARSYHVIENVAGQCVLFHIPSKILNDSASWEVVGNILTVLRLKNATILLISEGLHALHVAYTVLVVPNWLEDFNIKTSFVPWRHLEEIKPMGENEQRVFLPKVLKLEDLMTKARETPLLQITDAEISLLTNVFAGLPQFTDSGEQAWRLLLDQAGLRELSGNFVLGGPSREVAFRLISQLRYYAPLPAYPEDQVLGLLLCQVLTFGELKPDDSDQIRVIVKTYKLAPSRGDF